MRPRLRSPASVAISLLMILTLMGGLALANVKPWYEWCKDPATGQPKRTLKVWVDPDAGVDWKQWTQRAMANWNNAGSGWSLEMTSSTEGADVTVHAAPIPRYPDGSVSAGETRTDFDNSTGEVVGATIVANTNLDWGTSGDDKTDPVKMLKHELGHTMRLTHSEIGNLMDDSISPGDHNYTPNLDDVDEAKEAASTTRVVPEPKTEDGRVRMIAVGAGLSADPLTVSQTLLMTGHPLTLLPMEGIMLPQPLSVPPGLGRVICAAGVFPAGAEFELPVTLQLQWTEGAVSGLDLVGELHYHLQPPVDERLLAPMMWRPDPEGGGTGKWEPAPAEVVMDPVARTATMFLHGGGVYGLAGPYQNLPRAAGGPPFADVTVDEYPVIAEALTELRAMDIYRGYPDGTARPSQNLTRLEFFTLGVRLAGGEETFANAGTTRPAFTDEIPEWGWAYVNQAVAMGLARGYPDGTFRAGQDVTGAEALAVLVRVLGPEGDQVAAAQPWPQGYLQAADALGLLDDIHELVGNLDAWAAGMITRGQMAVLTRASAWTPVRYAAGGQLVADGQSIAAARGWWKETRRLLALTADGRRCVLVQPVDVLGLGRRMRIDVTDYVYLPPLAGGLPAEGDTATLLGRGTTVRAVLGPYVAQ